VLKELLDAGREQRVKEQAAAVEEFAAKFTSEFGVRMRFSDEAVARLIDKADQEKVSIPRLCERLFQDYEFGLKLLQRDDGREFVVESGAIDDPDKFLSDWLVKTYRDA